LGTADPDHRTKLLVPGSVARWRDPVASDRQREREREREAHGSPLTLAAGEEGLFSSPALQIRFRVNLVAEHIQRF
jgi:hypothetical protein